MKLIPSTDLTVSEISLGTATLATVDKPDDLLNAYLELGGNFIDTAWVYANWLPGEKHSSEKTIGRWMKTGNISRDSVVIATKGAHPEMDTMHIPRVTPSDIIQDIETSLSNLQLETIDLYWLHRDDKSQPVEPIIDALQAQVNAGKIRYYACSNWTLERIKAANDYANSAGHQGFVANQPLWSMAEINPEAINDPDFVAMNPDLYAYHQQTGMAVIPFSSQAKGYYSKLETLGLDNMPEKLRAEYDNVITRNRYTIAQEIAQRTGYTLNQIALAYLTHQPFTTIPIVGCKTLDHLTDSMSALEATLSDTDFAQLQASE